MHMITRRNLLKILLALSKPALFLTSIKANSVEQRLIEHEDHISLEKFLWLSQIITKQNNLDEQTSRIIYQLIMNEPYGNEHLKNVFARFKQHQAIADNDGDMMVSTAGFSDGEQWFISHLLITWYTGVYYHDKGNEFITIQNALMYDIQSDYRQPPTYCNGKSGFWIEPPNTHHNDKIKTI